jgi:hypothetical protein
VVTVEKTESVSARDAYEKTSRKHSSCGHSTWDDSLANRGRPFYGSIASHLQHLLELARKDNLQLEVVLVI